jgi:hypothetical protein
MAGKLARIEPMTCKYENVNLVASKNMGWGETNRCDKPNEGIVGSGFLLPEKK